jgi:hypothetical protein
MQDNFSTLISSISFKITHFNDKRSILTLDSVGVMRSNLIRLRL